MKIKLPAHAALYKGYIVLKEVNNQGKALIEKFFSTKNQRDGYNGKDFIVQVELDLPYQKRTFKQNSSVWILVTAIFQSMEGRLPDEEEKYGLYLDLLEQYAEKVSNRFGGMRPVHISESNSYEGARFIDGLLYHLATLCDLDTDTQSDVVSVLQDWENWRGTLEADPLDYADLACTRLLTEEEWRGKHPASEASGRSGDIVRAHIVSRGADHPDIEMAWNWLALLHDEHMDQHQKGWDEFLQIYPHLKGKVDRARRLAGKLELKNLPQSGSSLALEALEA